TGDRFMGAPEYSSEPATGAYSAERPLVILNPAGNRGRCAGLRGLLEQALTGGRGELALTNAPGAAEKMAGDAARAGRAIIAVGGDGTLSEVACGILASGHCVPLGIVPAGSGNDYACETLKLPRDPLKALDIALHGTPTPMDAGAVNERFFINSLGVGIDANIAARAERLKRVPLLWGKALYQVASIYEVLFRYDHCPQLRVSLDGAGQDERAYALAAVTIGPTYGGGFRINPSADATDGLFDLCLIEKPAQLRALRLLPMVKKGQHSNQPEVRHLRVRSLILEADQPIFAHCDGEVFTAQRCEARILSGALLIRRG
ncbi:MAG TPA: YegS/Rv2252/BmrU family lipid kinase, partial [Ktedonobacterales bacterium]|nr:YegS/Rv2252/BmrU family lipid kinase [Ktedonobacterales bacterium]